jgi:hypothetical protein
MTKLTAEWEGLVSKAERIEADYPGDGKSWRDKCCDLTSDSCPLILRVIIEPQR